MSLKWIKIVKKGGNGKAIESWPSDGNYPISDRIHRYLWRFEKFRLMKGGDGEGSERGRSNRVVHNNPGQKYCSQQTNAGNRRRRTDEARQTMALAGTGIEICVFSFGNLKWRRISENRQINMGILLLLWTPVITKGIVAAMMATGIGIFEKSF